jgi:hypothetical protein
MVPLSATTPGVWDTWLTFAIGRVSRYFANYWLFCRSFVPLFGEHTAPTEAEFQEMWCAASCVGKKEGLVLCD